MRRAAVVSLFFVSGCSFNPDLSRFLPCEAGACPAGAYCLAEAQRCVPECGEDCADEVDAGQKDAGVDAGVDGGEDAGTDAGLTLAEGPLPAAVEKRPYSFTFRPSGGQGTYSFDIDGGVPGFSLSVGGELATSSASAVGTFRFSITVEDQATPQRKQVTTAYSLEVRPLLRVASPGSPSQLVEGRQGQLYSQRLFATGGSDAGRVTLPYKWVIDGGALPQGLSLVDLDGGVIEGTPGAQGIVSFGVTVSDSATPPQLASRMLTIETKALDTVFVIVTRHAAEGRVGTPYSQPLKAYGGVPGYTWSITSGVLPPGVALVGAELSGTPTAAGTYPMTVRGADSLNISQSVSLTITVF